MKPSTMALTVDGKVAAVGVATWALTVFKVTGKTLMATAEPAPMRARVRREQRTGERSGMW
jgi:hypothetical protein